MSQNLQRKLPQKVHISYGFLCFAVDALWNLNTYFLLFFYTDVIRIPPRGCDGNHLHCPHLGYHQ